MRREIDRAGIARILIQNRQNALTAPGGDTVVMNRLSSGLTGAGYDVVVDLDGTADPAEFDLVHLINFALPDLVKHFAQRAVQAGTPFVVTTLCEDVAAFHNQSHAFASLLIEYVQKGQDTSWFQHEIANARAIAPAESFDNQWAYDHAAGLFVNGQGEREILHKLYGKSGNIYQATIGFEIQAHTSPRKFIEQYGVQDFVLCVGRFESRKNQLMLLQALEHSDLPVVLVSGGFTYQPDYAQAVRDFKRKGETLIVDRLDSDMLSSAYAAARVHALPSWFELPGLVSLEAAASNCQVVAVRSGTTGDYLGDHAFYCNPDNVDSIKNATLAAYHCPISTAMKSHVKAFSWDRFIDETVSAYGNILRPQQTATVTAPSNQPDELEVLLVNAENAAREKQFEQALRILAEVDQLSPELARTNRNRGAIYLAQNDHEQAKNYFTLAYKGDPQSAKTLSGLGMCLMMEKKPSEAYPLFLEALEIEPFQLVTILQLMECAYALEIFSDLELALHKYLQANREDLDMRYCYAGCLFKQGRISDARIQLDIVLEKKPDHQGASELLENIEEQLSQPGNPAATAESMQLESDAEVDSSQSETLDYTLNSNLSIDQRIGELQELKQRREYSEVRAKGFELLENEPLQSHQQEAIELLVADCCALLEDIEQASEIYRSILGRNNRSARAWCGQGVIDASEQKWGIAEEKFRKAVELDPRCDAAFAGLALCATRQNQTLEAWELYNKALELNPENSRAILGIISLGYPLRKYAEVEDVIRKYLELHPADLNMLYSLAGCLFAQQRVDEARDELEKILIFDKEHSNANELLSTIEQSGAGSSTSATVESASKMG